MIIPDVSVLIHAYNSDSPQHAAARAWWEETLAGPRPVGMAWVVLLGFIRIITNRGIFDNPMRASEATRRVEAWLAHTRVLIVTPGDRHGKVLFRLLNQLGVAGNLTTDAHLAALAIEYQAEVASTDTDFARFKGLRWYNPLGRN